MLLRLQNGPGNRAAAGLLLKSGLLQPSLRVGAAHDSYEREADRMADRVMQNAPGTEVSALPAPAPATAQRMCAECEEEETMRREATGADAGGPAGAALESRVVALRGGGAPLSPAQRGFFEPRFGLDFGGVRLHSGPAAAEAARLARARAFTVGRDIAFAAGEYRPETNSGQRLLAHELTHVVQQTPLVARRKPLLQRQAAPGADAAGSAGPEPETPGPESPSPEQEPEPAGPEPDEAANAQTPAPGLLVEDDAKTVGPEQMTRGAFLAEVRASACAAVDSALAGTEMSSQGCPYVELILRFYERRSAERIERDLVNYAPEAANVTSARSYVPIVADRVRQSAVTYAETGEITGIPEGVPLGLRLLAGAGALFGGLFFKARDGGPKGTAHPHAVRTQLGAGRPLGGSVHSRMQSAFGRGFSGVRVHTGATASRLSSRFNARAFTVGQHVAFGAGEYRPGTPVGDALIAHELAHVVQQRGAGDAVAPMQSGPGAVGALERDADRSAAGVVASLWGGATGVASKIARNAVPSLRSGLRLQRCPSSQQVRPPRTPAQEQQQAPLPNQPADQVCDAPTRQSLDQTRSCCTLSMLREISQLRAQALPIVNNATRRLDNPESVRSALWDHFRVQPDDDARISIIKNRLEDAARAMTSDDVRFLCNDLGDPLCRGKRAYSSNCPTTTLRYITLCGWYLFSTLEPGSKYLSGPNWLKTIIHEYAHVGCSQPGRILEAGKEFYMHLPPYPPTNPDVAVRNADSYANFALAVGGTG